MAIKYNGQDLVKRYINGREVEKVMKNWVQIWPAVQPTENYLCFTANTASSSLRLDKYDSPTEVELEISTNGLGWFDYTIWTDINLVNIWDKVYFRNKATNVVGFSSGDGYYTFNMTGSISASWDINYLLCKYSTTELKRDCESCYRYLFANCTSLTTAPELPATRVYSWVYYHMFENCTSLAIAPALPATTLGFWSYDSMFKGCTSLTTAPELPATSISSQCYSQMFSGCTSLTTAPSILPATRMHFRCYSSMFRMCTSLTTAPALLATTLDVECCSGMFSGCSSLTTAPALPATTLSSRCYQNMFSACVSLTTIPALPATTLSDGCYNAMFWRCPNIKISETQTSEYNVPYRIPISGEWTSGTGSLSDMFGYTWWTFTWTPEINRTYYTSNTVIPPTHSGNYLCFTANTANSSVGLYKYWTPYEVELETSVDKQTWSDYTIWTDINLVNVWDKVYFRNKASDPVGFSSGHSNNYYSFYMRGSVSASWDVNYLLCKYSTPYLTQYYSFARLFSNCASLTTAPELPATTLARACYIYMFEYCTSLTTAPELPATTLADDCYEKMFSNCTSLTTAPVLPATTLAWACYGEMFEYCTSLTTLPELPALGMTDYCYHRMFQGCSNIKISETQTSEYNVPYRIPVSGEWVDGRSRYAMFTDTWWTFRWTPEINRTYYTSNTVV